MAKKIKMNLKKESVSELHRYSQRMHSMQWLKKRSILLPDQGVKTGTPALKGGRKPAPDQKVIRWNDSRLWLILVRCMPDG